MLLTANFLFSQEAEQEQLAKSEEA